MKVTKIRVNGLVPEFYHMESIVIRLNSEFKKAGFVTNVSIATKTSLNIGLHMRCFTLDLSMHDRNLQCNPYQKRLTNLPTWSQRVEFNDIVNKVLNKFKVSANVKSGPYTIRQGLDAMNEYDWNDQKPSYIQSNEANGYYIESINEKEYLESKRIERNEKNRKARLDKKSSTLGL